MSKTQKKGGIEFFIDPMLPIDLLAVEMRDEVDDETEELKHVSYYTLYWLALTEDPNLERRLQFYRFYLSRISKLKGVQIIIVIPANAPDELETSLQNKAKENGFGLWSVDLSKEEPEVLLSPKDFREFMEDTFQNPPKGMIRFDKNILAKKR